MWLWVFVTLAVISIVVLLAIVILDLARQERQRRAIEESVMNVLSTGLTGVVAATRQNLQTMSAGSTEAADLQRLSLEYWALVVSQPPRPLVRAQLIETIADVTHGSQQLNAMLDARDLILASETDPTALKDRLSAVDSEYARDGKALIGRVETLAQQIDAAH